MISPVSLYAASKKSNELMAHAYCKLYGIACTGLRYFTVYGPAGRPDMAPHAVCKSHKQRQAYQGVQQRRHDARLTYIDDIANGTIMVLDKTPDGTGTANGLPYKVYNIGLGSP